jgi:hypothetical protein
MTQRVSIPFPEKIVYRQPQYRGTTISNSYEYSTHKPRYLHSSTPIYSVNTSPRTAHVKSGKGIKQSYYSDDSTIDSFKRSQPQNIDYDYYDDNQRIVGRINQEVKVILHGGGVIECLEIGNFPHPKSCKKFISCAKMEIGGIVGWEYRCPRGLSYDPVGGICNWSLGCKE